MGARPIGPRPPPAALTFLRTNRNIHTLALTLYSLGKSIILKNGVEPLIFTDDH